MPQFEVLIRSGVTPTGEPSYKSAWGVADSISQVRGRYPQCVVLEVKDIQISATDIEFDFRVQRDTLGIDAADSAVGVEAVTIGPQEPRQ